MSCPVPTQPYASAVSLKRTLAETTGDYAAAEVALESAYFTATRADAWETAAEAASALILRERQLLRYSDRREVS